MNLPVLVGNTKEVGDGTLHYGYTGRSGKNLDLTLMVMQIPWKNAPVRIPGENVHTVVQNIAKNDSTQKIISGREHKTVSNFTKNHL